MTIESRIGSVGWMAILVALASMLTFGACGGVHGPVLDRGEKPPTSGGTISGIVRAAGSNAPLADRRVAAVDAASGAKYEVSTAVNGGYTMKVPVGKYRLEVELRAGESVAKGPSELTINNSDLDAQRDFVIAMQPRH